MLPHPLALGLLLASLPTATSAPAHAEEAPPAPDDADPSPTAERPAAAPVVATCPGVEVLRVRVIPAPGTHVDPTRHVRFALDDGYFSYAHRDHDHGGAPAATLALFRERRISGWTLEVDGSVCADGGPCAPFSVRADLARGALHQRLTTTVGPVAESSGSRP